MIIKTLTRFVSFVFLTLVLNITVNAQDSILTVDWAITIGDTGDYDGGVIIHVDDSGNVYTIGKFSGTSDFDPGVGVHNLTSVGYYSDYFIQKLDSNGQFVWALNLEAGAGINQYLSPIGVKTDHSGNVYIAGEFEGSFDVDPGIGVTNLTYLGSNDTYIQKFNSNGQMQWAKMYGGIDIEWLHDFIIDDYGFMYFTGTFSGTSDFDPGVGVFNLTSWSTFSMYVSKLDINGNFIWAKKIGATSHEAYGEALVQDNSGDICILGFFEGTMDFDPNSGVHNLTSIGKDIFIEKIDTSGNFVWVKHIGSASLNLPESIGVDATNNIYYTGKFKNTLDLDPGPSTFNLTSAGGYDILISKLDVNGNFVWANRVGGSADDITKKIVLDNQDNIFHLGSFEGTIDFDPDTSTFNLSSKGFSDAFIQKLDSNGDLKWACIYGDTGYDSGGDMTIDENQTLYVTGAYKDSIDINPNGGIHSLVSNGGYDGYTVKFGKCLPVYDTQIVVSCNSYTWINGMTYSSSMNNVTHTVNSSSGCDSVIYLDLTINQNDTTYQAITACNSYTWINGITYTSSNNSGQYVLTNSKGCDSLIFLDLTINYPNTGVETVTTCNSYTWINGVTYTSSINTVKDTLQNTNGCDSVVSLDLTIINSTFGTDTIVACNSYLWNGNLYTSSNYSAKDTLVNAVGCDSIVTLHLTILNSSYYTDVINSCYPITWLDGNTYFSDNHTATHIIPNSSGCDSIITLQLSVTHFQVDTIESCGAYTWRDGNVYLQSNSSIRDTVFVNGGCDSVFVLNLTIRNIDHSTDVITSCDSLTWINGITYYSGTNSVKDTLINQFGCDSIVTLDLTVNYSSTGVDSVSACMFYQWINGQIYLSDNHTASHTLTNSYGCDSIVNLDLEINYGTLSIDTHIVCDSLVWIDGNTYYTNNTTAVHTLVGGNSNGCDSVVMLNLTVNGSSSTDVVNSCGSYTWIDGNTYISNNNTATYTTQNALGCDSTVTLDLTVNMSTYGTEIISACDNYIWNGITYTSSNNTAQDTLINALGCDSIVILDLTILNSTTSTDMISSCDPITWLDGNTYSTNNNTATHTIQNVVGCDSVITLDFTLLPTTYGIDSVIAVNEYTWIDGITYFASNNTATYTILNQWGCDSIITLNLFIQFVEIGVHQNGPVLSVVADYGTFQWVECPDYNIISGATDSVFVPVQNGSYAVIVTQNGYTDTSDCIVVNNVGIEEPELIGISLYPNPTSDVLNIDKGNNASLQITIMNSTGAMVHQSKSTDQITTINMAQMATGTYIVTLQNELGIKVERVIKR